MKMIIKILLRIILLCIILFLVTRILKRADESLVLSPVKSYYSKGSAPDSTRREIIDQLKKFQDGYTKRDTGQVNSFMESLYPKENILILGTMPNEVFSGYKRASYLVRSDWESWGDCRFAIDSANISSDGNTAWFAAKGFVKFDLSKLLVLPLRFTGVMVKEDQVWKFRQQQFQFDLDFSFLLIVTLILSIWIVVSLVSFVIGLKANLRKSQGKP
jgi:hypothetical protein